VIHRSSILGIFLPAALAMSAPAQQLPELFHKRPGSSPRWITFENPKGVKGGGALENKGAKGHPADPWPAGQTKTLMDLPGAGVVRHIWLTIPNRDPQTLRSLRVEMYWDGATRPAVSAPLGDFFGAILGRTLPLENEFFTNPEGRSFNCYIPMPFRKRAVITVTNESGRDLRWIFYQIDVEMLDTPDPNALYFHAFWHRVRWTELGKDFEILPRVAGEGRFLGTHFGLIGHPANVGWWGEGEVKIYLDGDMGTPTLVGTGTEDYIGTGWGQGLFQNRFQGSVVNDADNRQWAFYRYHVPDPIFFHKDLRVTIQQMGGSEKENVLKLLKAGVEVQPVTIDWDGKFTKLLEEPGPVDLERHPSSAKAWVNMYRRDDASAIAFFYLDKPENELPPLPPVATRVVDILKSAK